MGWRGRVVGIYMGIEQDPVEVERALAVKGLPRWVLVASAVGMLAILGGGGWFYRTQREYLCQEAENDLEAIAQLKADQIVQWRAERLGDASVLMEDPFCAEAVGRWLADPQAGNAEALLAHYRSLQRHSHYSDVVLVDASGKARLSLSGDLGPLHAEETNALAAGFRDQRSVFCPLHSGTASAAARFSIVAPFFTRNGSAAAPLGAVILWGDARQFLYPLIQTWPTPSGSAETLLVCREGDAVLYLNDLRHQDDTALKLSIPLTQTNLPAVMAVLGREGIFRGKDYRGVEVLSALKAVPNSPWFIVAKVDAAEAFAAWRWRSGLILVLLLASLALACAAILVVWQRREKAHYRALFYGEIALTTERERAAEHIQKVNAELEERVRERTGELEAANKELEAFSYSVSHDLRTPLRAVEGFSRILEEQSAGRLDAGDQRLLGVIRGETLRMKKLIDDLLSFSRMAQRTADSSEIDMKKLAEEVIQDCAGDGTGRQIRFNLGSLLPALGDRMMVRQALVNLIGNAVKYTRPKAEAEIELGSRSEGNENVYWIKDNGVGFDPRYSDKLFVVFQRLHSEEEFEGTGVGLALVQRIVHRHGGRVWAEGKVNGGATFHFTLRNR